MPFVVFRAYRRPEGGQPQTESRWIAARAVTYAGDADRARAFHARLADQAASPTLRAFVAYVGGEIDSAAGHSAPADQQYSVAIELARAAGATFIVNIASVGLLTVLVDAGRVEDALRGYRDVVDYFARTGNWSHLWKTLRNLARLLRTLGEHETADLLDTAADHAPDAPPDAPPPLPTDAAPAGRAQALDAARRAIEENLAWS